jgi:acetyl-CoA carboxylase biotin carboxylase subunit
MAKAPEVTDRKPRADAKRNRERILEVAKRSRADAIHPGYGLLAENANFAEVAETCNIKFIGPPPEVTRLMGEKEKARAAMKRAGVPILPGSDGILASDGEAMEWAKQVGFPVIIKASAGGGGRGMRIVRSEAELPALFKAASSEAAAAFGNGDLYMEKFIERPRHIEFQVLADGYGHVVHLGERECSIQRNHQKLVEESPSPVVTDEERGRLGGLAAKAAASFGYVNAGTLEFLRASDGRMFFMEMNTRLQVEHAVTELVTGIDLVKAQLAIAAGVRLALAQDDVRPQGHAVEFRINAEDPDRGFRPDPGLVTEVAPPEVTRPGAVVRWDAGVAAGWRVPSAYDSMIGKVIVHAATRAEALAASKEALSSLRIAGIKTTIPLHLRLLDDAAFARGDYDVAHLSRAGLIAPQPIGIAAPILVFVVQLHYRQQILEEFDALENLAADLRMQFHQAEFLVGQWSRLL